MLALPHAKDLVCNTDVRFGISFVETTVFPPHLLIVLGLFAIVFSFL